jgi:hypothetical protein
MGIASRVGTLTGTTTTDTITITGLPNPVTYISVRLRNPASGDKASFRVATGAGNVAADLTIDADDCYHLDNTRPEHPVPVNATDISIKIRGTASATYVVIGE